jgi:Dissimilatory sulfite reductase (desulfoviridin), alpha and beta subunits
MKINNLHIVWFSATATTKHITELVAGQFIAVSATNHDITKERPESNVQAGPNDLLIAGVPVYAGRVPAIAVDALNRFKGEGTPAIIVCVYGNRDYDDALIELKDILQTNAFIVISAGTFIAQHSIFPAVGASRPDEKDKIIIADFARKSAKLLAELESKTNLPDIIVKGNRPYTKPGRIPLSPKTDKKCNKCGLCIKICPTNAIPSLNPRITFGSKCIACARCISLCPQQARHFGGILYRIVEKKFVKTYSVRKEPEVTYIKPVDATYTEPVSESC